MNEFIKLILFEERLEKIGLSVKKEWIAASGVNGPLHPDRTTLRFGIKFNFYIDLYDAVDYNVSTITSRL